MPKRSNDGSDINEHPLGWSWPPFLDFLDQEPQRAQTEFSELAWKVLIARPPLSLARSELEDLIQEVIMFCVDHNFRVLRKYRRKNFANWLRTVARNKAYDRYSTEPPSNGSETDRPAPGPDPENETVFRELLEKVEKLIKELKEYCQLLLRLAGEGLKPREMAPVLRSLHYDKGNKQASDDLRRCRKLLRDKLSAAGIEL